MMKIFWLQIYPFQAISSNFGFCGRKAPPPQNEGTFLTSDLSISCNFEQLWFLWQKSHPQNEGKFFDFRSINFRQFQTTLVLVAEKPPPPKWGKIFWLQIYQFHAILSNFGFCGRKATPKMRENFLTSDLSISGNFEQLWFWWQKSPPPPNEGKFFDFRSIHFSQFWATLVFVAEKPPPPKWGKIFWLQIYLFQAISSNFGFCGRKAPPPGWGKNFWLQIYPFQAISSNFGFGGRKAPPKWGKFFDFRSIHSRQFQATLVLVAEKPPPKMREDFLTSDLSISGNFEQLWYLWQKSPPPPGWGKNFWLQIYPFQAISSNFGFCGRKAPPSRMREKFWTSDLSISCNFEQLWFLWQKSPPPQNEGKILWLQIYPFQAISSNFGFCGRKAQPTTPQDEGKFFDFRSIYFRQFRATLVFVAEKALPHPPRMRDDFLTSDLSISGNFEQLWFLWQKSPPKFFDFRSIHFRQFRATLVLVAKKPPPTPKMREIFLTSDLSISGNFEQLWFLWQKSPPPRMRENFLTSDLSISGNFKQLWYLWQKSPPPPPQDEGKIFDFRSIHFMQFRATLVFVAEKPPTPKMRENFLTSDLSISGNFKQLWFLWQKSPPQWGNIF